MLEVFDPVDEDRGFVGVEDGFLRQDLLQAFFKGLQRLLLLLTSGLNGRFTDAVTEHLLAHFTDAQAGSLGKSRKRLLLAMNGRPRARCAADQPIHRSRGAHCQAAAPKSRQARSTPVRLRIR